MTRRVPKGRRGCVPSPASGGEWVVALPAWGDRAVGVLTGATLPAVVAALAEVERAARLVVWTDQADVVSLIYGALNPSARVVLECRPVPAAAGPYASLHEGFGVLSTCHAQVISGAGPHDRVLLLTADMVVSREVVSTCDALLSAGKRLVCCAAMRATEGADPPVAASGRDLLEWAWAHRHPMTRECTWPGGRSYDVWRQYFERGDEVAARVFLPHPLAVVHGGRRLSFGPTIDVNLTSNFSRADTYMITSPDEGAVVELSPSDKEFLLTTSMRERLDAGGPSCPPLVRCTNARHRMFFEKRVVIRGSGGDCGDDEVVRRVMG